MTTITIDITNYMIKTDINGIIILTPKHLKDCSYEPGSNPNFTAFLDLKKHIATKLGVSNGPKVGKVAGAVQRDMKEKFPSLSSVEISKKGMEHFDKNMDHYKQMLPV